MLKKTTFSLLLLAILFGTAGCRLPLIDPPIIGRWRAVGDASAPGTSFYYEFSRDKTGKMEIIGNKGHLVAGGVLDEGEEKQLGITTNFTWSYKRIDRIVSITTRFSTTEMKVDYNFLRTKATMYNIKTPNYRTDFELVSTPIFRL